MPPGNQHIQTTFRRVLPADQLTRKLHLRGGGDVSHLLGLQREPQRCHAQLNAHAGLTTSLCSANMNLPTALCCSGGCLPLSCFFFSLSFLTAPLARCQHNSSSGEGGACKHTHIYKQAYTKCNKKSSSSNGGGGVDGRLLSEFLVQLIFVCESGRGYNCSHVDWSQGERGGSRLALQWPTRAGFGRRTSECSKGKSGSSSQRGAGSRRREERERGSCSNGDLLLRGRVTLCRKKSTTRECKIEIGFILLCANTCA